MGELYDSIGEIVVDGKYRKVTINKKENSRRQKNRNGVCKNTLVTEISYPRHEQDIDITLNITETISCVNKESKYNTGTCEGSWLLEGNDNYIKITHTNYFEECTHSCSDEETKILRKLNYSLEDNTEDDWENKHKVILDFVLREMFFRKIGFDNFRLKSCCSSIEGITSKRQNKKSPAIKAKRKRNTKKQCPDSSVLGSCCFSKNNKSICEDFVNCEYCKYKNGTWNDSKKCEERVALRDSGCCKTCGKIKSGKIKGNTRFRSREVDETRRQGVNRNGIIRRSGTQRQPRTRTDSSPQRNTSPQRNMRSTRRSNGRSGY